MWFWCRETERDFGISLPHSALICISRHAAGVTSKLVASYFWKQVGSRSAEMAGNLIIAQNSDPGICYMRQVVICSTGRIQKHSQDNPNKTSTDSKYLHCAVKTISFHSWWCYSSEPSDLRSFYCWRLRMWSILKYQPCVPLCQSFFWQDSLQYTTCLQSPQNWAVCH